MFLARDLNFSFIIFFGKRGQTKSLVESLKKILEIIVGVFSEVTLSVICVLFHVFNDFLDVFYALDDYAEEILIK